MPKSLLKSQFATLEEPDSSEALKVDIRHPIAEIVDLSVTGNQLGSIAKSESGQKPL